MIRSVSPQRPEDVVAEVEEDSPESVLATVEAARKAQRDWWRSPASLRSAALAEAASLLLERRDAATRLVVREVGKPVGEAAGEVARTASILAYYAQACYLASGAGYPPSSAGSVGLLYTERRPRGVAGLITPWNFPLAIPIWKAAPALAVGNAVVLKPSPDAVGCGLFLRDLLLECLPEGLFSIACGGGETGAALVAAADVVSFTGSVAVGRKVSRAAVAAGVPVQCEMGGLNAAIVLPSAEPESTARMVAAAAMGYAGQKCTATSRVIVVGSNDGFVGALAAEVDRLLPLDPSDPACVVGPVINERALVAVRGAIDDGRSSGGRVLAGGGADSASARLGDGGGAGYFVEPTLFDLLPPSHFLVHEEVFGPVACVIGVDSLEEAVRCANSVRYGLVTSVHGQDLDAVLSAVAELDTGLVKVNAPTSGVDFYAPFGGEKDSSYGAREQGVAALDFYTSTRTVTITPRP